MIEKGKPSKERQVRCKPFFTQTVNYLSHFQLFTIMGNIIKLELSIAELVALDYILAESDNNFFEKNYDFEPNTISELQKKVRVEINEVAVKSAETK